MKTKSIPMFAILAMSLFVLVRMGLAAQQDRYTVKAPNGVSFSEFKGYENWQTVAVSRTGTDVKAILANPVMMKSVPRRYSRQWQAFSRRLPDCEDHVVQKGEHRVSLSGGSARQAANSRLHREGFQEIPGHEWMGICAV